MSEQPCFQKVAAAGGFQFHNCSRKVSVVRDGKAYCKIHDPVYVSEKTARKHAKWEAEDELKEAKWSLRDAAVGSYEKHCGEKARELAEADLLGEALTIIGRLVFAADAKLLSEKHRVIDEARNILAKLPKESK